MYGYVIGKIMSNSEETRPAVREVSQAFLKKLAMLPCPFIPAFLPFAELAGLAGIDLAFFGTGSSSENDSQTASSLVTVTCQSGI
jgi:hypothetical protein